MFEDSLFASRVGVVSARKRWTVAASVTLQAAVLAVLIVLPLWHPEPVSFPLDGPKVLMPLMPKPPVRVEPQSASAAASSSMALPSVTEVAMMHSLLPSLHPVVGEPPVSGPIGLGMTESDSLPIGIGIGDGHGPTVSVAPERKVGPVRVSTGVSEGLLLAPIRPVYPAIARAARVEGSVVVEAVISRAGRIESLRVVSGPMMLQNAALDAIREARYRPFQLNGEAVEVETRITVNFKLGG